MVSLKKLNVYNFQKLHPTALSMAYLQHPQDMMGRPSTACPPYILHDPSTGHTSLTLSPSWYTLTLRTLLHLPYFQMALEAYNSFESASTPQVSGLWPAMWKGMMSTVKKLSADYMRSHKIASMDLKTVRELIPISKCERRNGAEGKDGGKHGEGQWLVGDCR